MSIPKARDLLVEVLPHIPGPHNKKIVEALSLMYRQPPARPRAPTTKTTMTPNLAKSIRAYARAYPRAHNQDIADLFNVNPGRVSEALHGKW